MNTIVPILYKDLIDMRNQMKEMQNEIELLNRELNINNIYSRTTLQRMQNQEEHVAKLHSINAKINEIED